MEARRKGRWWRGTREARTGGKGRATAALATLAVGVLAGAAGADRLCFTGHLDSSQTTPPNPSTATGKALLVMDKEANRITVYLRYSGHDTSGNNASHVHGPAPPGQSNNPVFVITDPGLNQSPDLNVWDYDPVHEQDVIDGLMYINLHTPVQPAGEIRGQLYLDETPEECYLARLEAAQVTAGSTSGLSGEAVVVIDRDVDTLAYYVDVPGLAGEISAGIYGPAGPGAEGALLHALPLGDSKRGSWSYPPELEASLLAGQAYVQIETATFPQGELRGQVVLIGPGTWTVDATGAGDFADVQSAVDTVSDGAVIVVRPGTYDGFLIDKKGLTVVAEQGPGTVLIDGTVGVIDLNTTKQVLLSGLTGIGRTPDVNDLPDAHEHAGIYLLNDLGAVRLQDCDFTGADNLEDSSGCAPVGGFIADGWPGAYLSSAIDVAFTRCRFTGGRGLHFDVSDICSSTGTIGGTGGAGVEAFDAATALYGCMVRGGPGGGASTGGLGGTAYHCSGFGVFASGCAFFGGDGGFGGDFIPGDGGDGGDCLYVELAQAQLHDCELTPGAGGGSAIFDPGDPGVETSGPGAIIPLSGETRALRNDGLVRAGESITLEFEGPPGDHVYLLSSAETEFAILTARFHGIRLARAPHTHLYDLMAGLLPVLGSSDFPGERSPALPFMGVVGPSGTLTRTFTIADRDALFTGDRLFLQSFSVDTLGNGTLGSFGQITVIE